MSNSNNSLQVFYKVVLSTKTGLKSAIINNHPKNYINIREKYSIKYGINYRTQRWVNPKVSGTKIFVFNTLENAKDFLYKENFEYDNKLKIYKCLVRNPVPISEIGQACYLDEYYNTFNIGIYYTQYAPSGTNACDSVFLYERVL